MSAGERALEATAAWRTRGWGIVGALSITETVSWGILDYAFAVFLMASFRILGGVSAGRAFAAGILVSGAAWVFFVHGLAVQLPAGLLEFF